MSELENLERDHENRMLGIRQKYGVRVKAAQTEADNKQRLWDEIYAAEERLPRYAHPLFYWPFMGVLAILEAPLNRLSFELFFTESPLWSFFVALMCGVLLIALAHFLGLGICRFRYNRTVAQRALGRKAGGGLIVQLLILAAVIAAICYGIAILRQGYLLYALQADTSFADALAQQNYSQAAALVLSAGLRVEGVVFLVINLGVVVVGAFAAMLCHDPHPNFQAIDIALKTAERDLAFQERVLGEAMAREQRRYGAEDLKLRRRMDRTGRALPSFVDTIQD
jgi:hypothetical protein